MKREIALSALAFLTLLNPALSRAGDLYHFVKEIPVGGEGGWDYLSVDEAARRLYVTHATEVMVIDLEKDAVVGEIADTQGVHGFALAPKLHRGFASNGKEGTVSIVDLDSLKTLSKVPTGEKPDAILFESGREEVYAFNGISKSVTVFEAVTGKVVATVPLSGKPEFAACDSGAGRVYCNIEDKSELIAIDTSAHVVVSTWPIAPGEEASGLAIDVVHHRLFVGCHNRLMVMMDSANGKVLASVPIGEGVDANAFDPGTQSAFSSNGDGSVTIAREDGPDKLTVVDTLTTERGARTMALDPKTHRIYLASAQYDPADEGKKRRKIISGTLKILVYEMTKPAGG